MNIVGPEVELKYIKRIEGEETADGREITWANPIRFRGMMVLLTGEETLVYQQMKVSARYKVLTNYMNIKEKDRVQRNSIVYDVKLVDDKFYMGKILVVLLDVKT